jgi:hypothetical protein
MESLAAMLPVGPEDELAHRGARRRATRYPMHADVRVVGPEASEGVVLNASAGGLRVALDRGYAEGDRLEIEIEMVNDRTSRETAEVVWSRELPDGWLVGLRFAR